jgi:EAL domain-containing protein (putative c-di-GMP-specific phosphodiesterase class I)
LVRWRRSDDVIVPPYQFVPLFERNGFINKLDRYMFELVCRQQTLWLGEGLAPVPISVNMSRMCLYDPHIVDEYIGILEESGLPAAYVKLELTESAFFENTSIMNGVIEALHKVGIKVLMDDFGTGYSSMMMLKNVDIDVLKLDKSFVDDIGDERSEKIISNIIYLAHSLQIEVTAEGVETKAQFEFLRDVGCDYIQGYYFGKPQPAEAFADLLQKETWNGSDADADTKS